VRAEVGLAWALKTEENGTWQSASIVCAWTRRACFRQSRAAVCTGNSNPDVMMVKPAEDRA
jgi:hypothetical protein